MKREFEFTLDGKIVARFLNMLYRDKDFDVNQPITDTYMFSVGDEIGLSISNTQMVIDLLTEMKIIK